MKKFLSMTLLLTAMFLMFSACSKDDSPADTNFDYPLETLYGRWSGTHILLKESGWVDITRYPFTHFGFSITFHSDGTYYGSGYWGTGSGTYKTEGSTIYTYVDGKEYYIYKVRSLTGNEAELSMGVTGSDTWMEIKVKKE